jgi:hypothetical protein
MGLVWAPHASTLAGRRPVVRQRRDLTNILSDHSFQDISDLYKAMGGSASLSLGVIVEVVGGLLAVGGGVLALVKKS